MRHRQYRVFVQDSLHLEGIQRKLIVEVFSVALILEPSRGVLVPALEITNLPLRPRAMLLAKIVVGVEEIKRFVSLIAAAPKHNRQAFFDVTLVWFQFLLRLLAMVEILKVVLPIVLFVGPLCASLPIFFLI